MPFIYSNPTQRTITVAENSVPHVNNKNGD